MSFNHSDNWIKGSDDTYYFYKPINSNEETSDLLSDGSVIELIQDEEGNKQVVEIFAEAIQSNPSKSVINSWGVVLDSNGNILSVL